VVGCAQHHCCMKLPRILLVDDHEIFRRGLRAILMEQKGWDICDEAVSGRQAVELAEKLHPDVIIMDVAMPELNGLDATRQIRRSIPQAEILILTFDDSEDLIYEAINAGARSYVLKNDGSRVVVQAVESLSQHRPFFTSKVAEVLMKAYRGEYGVSTQPAGMALTSREREVVQLVAEGYSTKEVAHRLSISTKTAENHRANIMRKLNLRSVSDLVRYAIRNRIITP